MLVEKVNVHVYFYEQVCQAPRGRIDAPASFLLYGYTGHVAQAVEANNGGSTDVQPGIQDWPAWPRLHAG